MLRSGLLVVALGASPAVAFGQWLDYPHARHPAHREWRAESQGAGAADPRR